MTTLCERKRNKWKIDYGLHHNLGIMKIPAGPFFFCVGASLSIGIAFALSSVYEVRNVVNVVWKLFLVIESF